MLDARSFMKTVGLHLDNIIESLIMFRIYCQYPDFLAARYDLEPNFYIGALDEVDITPSMTVSLNALQIYREARDIETTRYKLLMEVWGNKSCPYLGFPAEACARVRESLSLNYHHIERRDELLELIVERVRSWTLHAQRHGSVPLKHREHPRTTL